MRDMREVMRDEMIMQQKILNVLQDNKMTIPEIAEALERPTRDVVLWLMPMRRYGHITEVGRPNADGYFYYKKIEKEKDTA